MQKLLSFFTILILLSLLSFEPSSTFSQTSCPSSMSPQARYDCLQKELNELNKNQSELKEKLKNEDYNQLTLREKIDYLNIQITQNEDTISKLHLEILTQDLEITILTKEIQQTENDISLHKQEITLLEETVNKRVEQSYKYSMVSTLDLLADVKSISTFLRKTKYVLDTRERDRETLKDFNDSKLDLEYQEGLLVEKKFNLQNKRNSLEENKQLLIVEQASLDKQRVEQDALLAESEVREREYREQLESVSDSIAQADEIVSDLIIQLFNQGGLKNGSPVVTGQVIGTQGHTGCSFGSHLHFEIRNSAGVKLNPTNYLNGGLLWRPVTSKTYRAPMDGGVLTQGYKSTHRAWDMVSMTHGSQGGTYSVPRGICPQVDNYIRTFGRDWAYLTGEGAPIKSITNGTVYYGTDRYGGKYALIKHKDGNTSLYLHLR